MPFPRAVIAALAGFIPEKRKSHLPDCRPLSGCGNHHVPAGKWFKAVFREYRRPLPAMGNMGRRRCVKLLKRNETIYFGLVSVVLAVSPVNLLPNISVSSNAIFQQDYST
ncbi:MULTISPECIES: hypothetical protein [unclassified Akkermansia]|uniref:hypothetical protein n=1 Tax=unclassified Akkermansia TaxID=2608915 RepID=UPI00122F332C|nr:MULTISPECIES: hypothetical protein [unclassified Akkermansia]KAA3162956.1 hypothetical protein F2A01_08500 [Akkermansia sp. BIOML-A60]KAA3191240.1 hypothetical protein F1991_02330 [Akkermansia sp. BIOML-A52]KAA3213523.1 hypothetical protein F1983_02305 [Akkermansia sp. BIOML-A42]KAA3213810.1 hypothetical protein F1982_07910 [Akkermansia sp. BIOML-A43]KAA3226261.1 hypothetical protein F1985_00140 [Akkermansia sp. BIOML-A41]KAA3237914.1 hypothetical protein F1956_06360 [Akkermansia sp. BIOML